MDNKEIRTHSITLIIDFFPCDCPPSCLPLESTCATPHGPFSSCVFLSLLIAFAPRSPPLHACALAPLLFVRFLKDKFVLQLPILVRSFLFNKAWTFQITSITSIKRGYPVDIRIGSGSTLLYVWIVTASPLFKARTAKITFDNFLIQFF